MDAPQSLSAAREALLATQPRYYGQRPDVIYGGHVPVRLNPPLEVSVVGSVPAVTYADDMGDWVSADLVLSSRAGAIAYVVSPKAMNRYLSTCLGVGGPSAVGMDASGLSRLNREATRAVGSRPLDASTRSRWALVDWSASDDGVRSAHPREALVTLVTDLDRLDALVRRLRSLASTTPAETRANLWRREADELAAFRTDHQRTNLPRLASLWAASVPELPPQEPPTPRRPPMKPARLR